MGHFVGNGDRRYFVDGGKVYSGPRGEELNLDPETLLPRAEPLVAPSVHIEEPLPDVGLKDFKDEKAVERFAKKDNTPHDSQKVQHAAKCSSGGRGGKYTEGCPKCDILKAGK